MNEHAPWPYPPAAPAPVPAPKPKTRKGPAAAIATGTFFLGLLFGSIGSAADEPAAAAAAAPAATSAPAAPPLALPTYAPPAPASDSSPAQFGTEKYTYKDGLVVQVSKPEIYQPGRWAAGNTNPVAVKVVITLTNSGSKAYDPATLMASASYAGQPADQIFDSQNNIGGSPQTSLLSGKTITFPVAFSIVEGPGELQVEITPSWNHTDSVFVGPID